MLIPNLMYSWLYHRFAFVSFRLVVVVTLRNRITRASDEDFPYARRAMNPRDSSKQFNKKDLFTQVAALQETFH